MSINLYTRLRSLLPPSPLLVVEVVSHNDDDTSMVRLPTGVAQVAFTGGVAGGALMQVRGTSVGVGQNAFVRDGVIETQAPSGAVIEIVVGGAGCTSSAFAFVGPVPDQSIAVGGAFTLDLSALYVGGFSPVAYAVSIGTLPAGLMLDSETGIISGTPTTAGVAAGLVIKATDSAGAAVATNAFGVTTA